MICFGTDESVVKVVSRRVCFFNSAFCTATCAACASDYEEVTLKFLVVSSLFNISGFLNLLTGHRHGVPVLASTLGLKSLSKSGIDTLPSDRFTILSDSFRFMQNSVFSIVLLRHVFSWRFAGCPGHQLRSPLAMMRLGLGQRDSLNMLVARRKAILYKMPTKCLEASADFLEFRIGKRGSVCI